MEYEAYISQKQIFFLLTAFGNKVAYHPDQFGTASSALNAYGTIIAGGGGPPEQSTWTQGWLNILVFDKNYNLVDAAYDQPDAAYGHTVGSSTKGPHQLLKKQVTITKPGFVYIYVSNESVNQRDIYFDDFKYTYSRGPIIQADDYYPFGLTFNSYSRENSTEQKYQYNGKELQDELNLGLLDYGARMYDPAISRWMAVDPLADLSRKWSPYTYGNDNPIRFIDPTGMYSTEEWKKDNGITDDDLITVYQAPSDNNEESNESKDQEEAKPVTPASRSVLGTTDYYKFRRDDFRKRYGKNKKAPTYYMSYGDKYAQRFSSELYPKLSGQGKEWLI